MGTEAAVQINGRDLTIGGFARVARYGAQVAVGDGVMEVVKRSREKLDAKIEREELIYGVTTGFGGNVKYMIPKQEVDHLQQNLLNTLSCGTGPDLSQEVVRGAILLRANALCKGFSAVRPVVIERLVALLNTGMTPVVPRFGSVGASGDLVPSAYIARALSGRGMVDYNGVRMSAAEALQQQGLEPILLLSKEGLALLNGTTVMTSLAALAVHDGDYLARLCIAAVAFSSEILKASNHSFDETIQLVKNHPGQVEAARLLRFCSEGSTLLFDLDRRREEIRQEHAGAHENDPAVELEESIQTPYSLRCTPQGLGAALDGIAFARETLEREMNSVNDNPLINPDTGDVYHTGNFYGGHVARVMDGVKIDLANVANWAHQLMAMLMDPRFSNGLPPNLSLTPGLHSGFKGMQLSQSSLVTALRQMCGPSSIHTLPTEQYNQDIVSLGLHSAATALDMIGPLRDALSILLLALSQAADFRGVSKGDAELGRVTAALYQGVRQLSAFQEGDRPMDEDIRAVSEFIRQQDADLTGF